MKTLFTTLFLGFAFTLSAQKLVKGYIVNTEGDTLHGSLNIAINKYIKFKGEEQSGKFLKLSMKDYGAVEDGQYISYFPQTAFNQKARKAVIYLNAGDSIPVYIYKQGAKKLRYYDSNNEKQVARIGKVDAYKVRTEKGNWYEYERVAVPNTYMMIIMTQAKKKKTGDNSLFFGQKLETGKINLYSTLSNRTTMTGNPTNMSSQEYIKVYLLIKGEERIVFPAEKLSLKSRVPVKEFMNDYPELSNKIGTKGYKLKDIQKIVKTYNQFWQEKSS